MIAERGERDNDPHDVRPVSVYLHVRPRGEGLDADVSASDAAALRATASGTIAPGRSVCFDIAIGLTYGDSAGAGAEVDAMFAAADRRAGDDGLYAAEWAARLPDLSNERDPVLRTEMLWNAYVLEAMATYNSYFEETFVPRGQVYAHQDGENISNRDHLQALLPLIYTNPALARSSLRHVLKHTTDTGEIRRGNSGYGYSAPGIYKESDEQLYVFLALGEYLRVTRDCAVLDDQIAYYPVESGRTDTVLNVLKKHFVYLRDEVGLGPHGLIRIQNSDWSDSFFHSVPINTVVHSAESHMNSAMALAVLPALIAALEAAPASKGAGLAGGMREYHDRLHAAMTADLGERDFLARAYLNDGKPGYGLDAVCVEAQGFLLQIPDLPVARKRRIYARVSAALKEKAGFRIHERPIFGGKGEGEDGAIWRALEGQFIKGVISFDKAEGARLLDFTSFHSVARAYPTYWLGQWTSFDGMQSHLSDREGLYNDWFPAIFEQAFVGFCCHPHAWPLYNYHLLRER